MHPPDLSLLEAVVKDLAISSIESFAAQHQEESFYAFGFDCNAEYGDVLLCLNTETDFARTSKQYIALWNYGPEALARLRKNFGDWQYQGFNLEQPQWKSNWTPHRQSVERYVFAEDTPDEDSERFLQGFMRMICQVLVQIERTGVLENLRRDKGFFTQVMDHDETKDAGEKRLADVRAHMAA